MKKVIIISTIPRMETSLGGIFPPIGSLSIASILDQNGYEVSLIDVSVDDYWKTTLIKNLEDEDVIAVGVCAYTSSSIIFALEAIDIVKRNKNMIPLIWGGHHASSAWREILEASLVDVVVRSMGEIAVLQVVKEIARKDDISLCDFDKINNIAFKRNGKIISNAVMLVKDMDCIPALNYNLIDVSKYDSMDDNRYFAYSSHGCPSGCTFCSESSHTNGAWTGLSSKRVVEDLLRYKEVYGAARIDYLDANFASDVNRVIEICKLLISKGIKIHLSANMKIRDVNTLEDEFGLKYLKEAGFDEIFVGVESGSDRILSYLHKGSSYKEILKACKTLDSAGIKVFASFMHDLPDETLEDSKITIELAKKMCEYNKIYQMHHIFFPFPNTSIYNQIFKGDRIYDQKDWLKYVENTTFGGSKLYEGNKEIRCYVKSEVEKLQLIYPDTFKGQPTILI